MRLVWRGGKRGKFYRHGGVSDNGKEMVWKGKRTLGEFTRELEERGEGPSLHVGSYLGRKRR